MQIYIDSVTGSKYFGSMPTLVHNHFYPHPISSSAVFLQFDAIGLYSVKLKMRR